MAVFVLALIALVAASLVRGREAFRVRWRPDRATGVAVATGLAAFLLSACLLFLGERTAPALIVHYLLIYLGCGFLVPWGYVLFVERAGLPALGLTRARLGPSLALNFGLGLFFGLFFLTRVNPAALNLGQIGLATVVLQAGGFFELFLYYGFIHLRLERSFGLLPAVLGTSILYVLWHVGTQLPLEPDPLLGALKLFGVGLMYQSVFSLTRSLFAIWPFFWTSGVLLDFVVNIDGTSAIASQWPYSTAVIAAMVAGAAAFHHLSARVGREPSRDHPAPADDRSMPTRG